MSILLRALSGVLVPAVLFAAVAVAAGGFHRREGARGRGAAAIALGLACAYVAGHRIVVGGWPPTPFGDVTLSAQQWRFFAAAAGGIVGAALALAPAPTIARTSARLVWLALVLRAALDARFRHAWDAGEGVLRLAALAFGVACTWTFVERRALAGASSAPAGLRSRTFAAVPAFELWAMASGTAICFQIARNSSNAQLAGALAGALGAALVLVLWRPRASLAPGGTAVVLPLLGAMWFEGVAYGEVPASAVVVLAAIPPVRALLALRFDRRGRPRRVLVEVAAVAVTAVAGVAAAVVATPQRTPYLPG